MANLFRQYQESDSNTKWFIWTGVIYGIAIILSTLYAYGRLDFVRTGQATNRIQNNQPSDSK